jgi:hypothetical protein
MSGSFGSPPPASHAFWQTVAGSQQYGRQIPVVALPRPADTQASPARQSDDDVHADPLF